MATQEYNIASRLGSDMPLPNMNLYKLIIKETNGNINAFAARIGVSQQLLDMCFRRDKDGEWRNFPKVKKAVMEYYNIDEVWFLTEHEELELAKPSTDYSGNKDDIIKKLTDQIAKLTEINERYSLMLEKLVSKIIGDEDIK